MTVSSKRVPIYANAVDFSEYIFEKRYGERIQYTATSDITVSEINRRLIEAEDAVTRDCQASWRPAKRTDETIWHDYRKPYVQYGWYGKANLLNKKNPPATVTLQHSPIILISSIVMIIDDTEVELVGNASYPEGWDDSYYVDYQNGFIFFRDIKPKYRTPIKVTYTYGNLESSEGNIIEESIVSGISSETSFSFGEVSTNNQYNGKLVEIVDGDAIAKTYRILSSSYNASSTITTLTFLSGYTASSDGVATSDTFRIHEVPSDIKEMTCIMCYLSILGVDPTYQHNYTVPFDDPNPQWTQISMLISRYNSLLSNRKSALTLLN